MDTQITRSDFNETYCFGNAIETETISMPFAIILAIIFIVLGQYFTNNNFITKYLSDTRNSLIVVYFYESEGPYTSHVAIFFRIFTPSPNVLKVQFFPKGNYQRSGFNREKLMNYLYHFVTKDPECM